MSDPTQSKRYKLKKDVERLGLDFEVIEKKDSDFVVARLIKKDTNEVVLRRMVSKKKAENAAQRNTLREDMILTFKTTVLQ